MKDLKLSFPYPSTSRHNLSQDVATSLSMGLVIPVRTVEVLGGDSHRIGTTYSLISNPLVKPLLQGIKMRYCRFWIPRRIYHLDQRANNSNFDLMNATVRHGSFDRFRSVLNKIPNGGVSYSSNFSQSCLFDYLGLASLESNLVYYSNFDNLPAGESYITHSVSTFNLLNFNAEPYVGYLDIIRNYFADSANGFVGWSWADSTHFENGDYGTVPYVSSLADLDAYIDNVQNTKGVIYPFDISKTYTSNTVDHFSAFSLPSRSQFLDHSPLGLSSIFNGFTRIPRMGLAIPLMRPDRLSRWFDTKPLTSQNAVVSPSEISISNLSFLSKFQRYITRRFFGGSRFTDVMYSVLGQKVPHVDSPILLDVFDTEVGSELVASTNATTTQSPGVLGGFLSSSGHLTTGRGSYRRRYTFNEPGYLMDLVYLMPRVFRAAFVPDFYFISHGASDVRDTPMAQSNFIPDFNGIGWQQPSQVSAYLGISSSSTSDTLTFSSISGFACEPSWQQYRTLPDVCSGAMNPLRSISGPGGSLAVPTINSPLFVFTDRMFPSNAVFGFTLPDGVVSSENRSRLLLSRQCFMDFNDLNSVFGVSDLSYDNIFVVFRYSHQAKRQVTKRFTLNFN